MNRTKPHGLQVVCSLHSEKAPLEAIAEQSASYRGVASLPVKRFSTLPNTEARNFLNFTLFTQRFAQGEAQRL